MKELLASDDDEENSSKVEKAYVPKLIGKENFIKVLTYIINALDTVHCLKHSTSALLPTLKQNATAHLINVFTSNALMYVLTYIYFRWIDKWIDNIMASYLAAVPF